MIMKYHVFSVFLLANLLELVSSSSDLSGGLGDLAKILAELAGGSECVFKCPRGERKTHNKHTAF
jgi:hypothetical protein